MATTKNVDLFIRPTSSATKQQAIDYAFDRANTRDSDAGEEDLAHFYTVTDARTGAIYKVFGTKAQDTLQLPILLDVVDKTEFIKGYADEVVISSSSGTHSFELSDDKVYSVMANVVDNSIAEVRIENKTSSGFDIALYDSSDWESTDSRFDCSLESIKVAYSIMFLE